MPHDPYQDRRRPHQRNVGGYGNRNVGGNYHEDNRAWHQNVDNRHGRYANRDYIENRNRAYYEGDQFHVDTGQDMGIGRGSGRGIGRLIAFIGMVIALAGFAAFAWTIFSFGASINDGGTPDLFNKEFNGLPVIPIAFGAFLAGGLIAGAGRSMSKAALRRHEQRERDRRRREYYR
ncbi:hypothetical protein [Alloactinosynnema sp. L-07]|uniref:ABC transporter permease n=1 Tax=Alloactinosynnema sp. L-07 TaxID=1653480 RepID=UPI00065EEFE7|nr:ABC transporter permease [Alloactinosynnema sp. L-07]CRK60591.1 hypothetical protein [Alloactinosynnema sp. L-07]